MNPPSRTVIHTMASERKGIHIRLSEEEHAIIAAYARKHGVSITAVVVALARWLDSDADPSRDVARCIDSIVREARRIDDERRARSPRQGA